MLNLFAGPIFVEWYWEPIFYVVFTAPVAMALAVLAILATLLVSRIKTGHGKLSQKSIVIICVSVLALWVLGYFAKDYYFDYMNNRPEVKAVRDEECRHMGYPNGSESPTMCLGPYDESTDEFRLELRQEYLDKQQERRNEACIENGYPNGAVGSTCLPPHDAAKDQSTQN